MAKNFHRGPWADGANAAIDNALAEVQVTREEFVVCEYSEGFKLAPIDESKSEINVDVIYSEARQQYRAELRRL